MPATSLYRQAMGSAFKELSPELQAFHSASGSNWLYGKCSVAGPENALGRIVARMCGLPEVAYEGDFFFEIEASNQYEQWRRKFKGRDMVSRMRVVNGVLVEQLGPLELHFALSVHEGRLAMHVARICWKGISLPRFLHPVVVAEETGANERLHFKVSASFPLIGRVVAYDGHLIVSFLMQKNAVPETTP